MSELTNFAILLIDNIYILLVTIFIFLVMLVQGLTKYLVTASGSLLCSILYNIYYIHNIQLHRYFITIQRKLTRASGSARECISG